jgi:hypothetical protein
VEEIKMAVSVLTQKAETDGRMPERKPRNNHQSGKGKGRAKPQGSQTPATTTKPKPKPRQNKDKKRPAAEANVVERKKRVKFNHAPGSDNGSSKNDMICYECGGKGHTAAYCRKYLQKNVKGGAENGGSAQLAEADSDDETDE